MSPVDFVELVASHEKRLKTVYDDIFLEKITDQHKLLKQAVATEPVLLSALKATAKNSFHEAWNAAGHRFTELRTFAGGLASVLPTTARVEGDFSIMGYRRDDNCANLSIFSLEGVLHSKQYTKLKKSTSTSL